MPMRVQRLLHRLTISTVVGAIAPIAAISMSTPTLAHPSSSVSIGSARHWSGVPVGQTSYSQTPTVLSTVLAQAVAQVPITPDASFIENGRYQNDFFGFSMDFPVDWAIASQETREAIMDVGTEIIAENNPALGASAEASLQNTYQLLLVSQLPLDNPGSSFNANLMGLAERVSSVSSLVTGADYLENHRALVGQTGLPYEAIGDIYPVVIGDENFYRSDFWLGGVIQQSYIFTVEQGYAYGFILSGLPEQMADLETIVESLQFEE